MTNTPVAGVVLAAGLSSRMGRNKMLLDFEGESLVRRTVGRALAAGLSPVIAVLGADAEMVGRELRGLECQIIVNDNYASGITSSLRVGLGALPPGAAALVLLADMPRVTSDMMCQMTQRYGATQAPVVISEYEGIHAPPILYDGQVFAELLAMADGDRGRDVASRYREAWQVMRWPASAMQDVDDPSDYLQAMRGSGSSP